MQSYASFLSRNGARDEAIKLYEEFDKQLPRYPLAVEALTQLRKGETLPRLIDTVQDGAAEALYGLGAALGRREDELSLANRGLAYLQLALYLESNHALALLVARRPLRGDEEAGARHQGLRARAGHLAPQAQRGNPARHRSRLRSIAPTRQRSTSSG